jgi:multiple sugar transport system substrate-binding protein
MPTDELSRFAFQEHDTKPENPVAPETAAVQNILNDAHSEIMSGSASVEDALAKAEERVASEVGLG